MKMLKKILLFGFMPLLVAGIMAFGEVEDVVQALKTGNAALMSKHFDTMVEITLPDKSNSYSKSQADLIIKDFFSSVGVTGFSITTQSDGSGPKYIIGQLQTKKGEFRTTVFIKQKGDKQYVRELRFETP